MIIISEITQFALNFVLGKLDPTNNTVTGYHIAYIYPDKETAFLGRFENKFMRKAQESSVQVKFDLKMSP
jgi:hypothetical protein